MLGSLGAAFKFSGKEAPNAGDSGGDPSKDSELARDSNQAQRIPSRQAARPTHCQISSVNITESGLSRCYGWYLDASVCIDCIRMYLNSITTVSYYRDSDSP